MSKFKEYEPTIYRVGVELVGDYSVQLRCLRWCYLERLDEYLDLKHSGDTFVQKKLIVLANTHKQNEMIAWPPDPVAIVRVWDTAQRYQIPIEGHPMFERVFDLEGWPRPEGMPSLMPDCDCGGDKHFGGHHEGWCSKAKYLKRYGG